MARQKVCPLVSGNTCAKHGVGGGGEFMQGIKRKQKIHAQDCPHFGSKPEL